MLNAFQTYQIAEGFDFQERTEQKIKDLKTAAQELHYGQEIIDELDRLAELVGNEKKRGFERYQDHIRFYLDVELSARLDGEQGRIEASLRQDPPLEAAIGILKDKGAYDRKIGH